MALIEVRQATKTYRLDQTTVTALRGVDLTVEPGELLAIAGPSGSGKTTLLHLIGCIERPTAGAVRLEGRDTAGLADEVLARLRAERLGFIFQTFNLLPVLTALENVEYPLLLRPGSAAERRRRALSALDQVGLSSVAAHRPMQLSGGQRQRVAIARAIVTEPRLVLADEPTANLDRATGGEIIGLMQTLNRRHGTTFVFSTHDSEIMQRASRIVHLRDGLVTA